MGCNKEKSEQIYDKSKAIVPEDDSEENSPSNSNTAYSFDSQRVLIQTAKKVVDVRKSSDPNTMQVVPSRSRDKIIGEHVVKTSSVSYKWQWVQFQIQNLEFKILQTNDILRRIRTTQEPKAEFDEIPFVLSQDGTTEETESAARVRGVKSVHRKKLGSTLSVIAQSQGFLAPAGNHCACPPNTCCIICGGPGVMYIKNLDRSSDSCLERIDTLYPKHHRVLSSSLIPLAAQYGRLIKEKKCNSKPTTTQKSTEIGLSKALLGVKKHASKDKSSNHLQMLLQSKKKSRQAKKEAQWKPNVELKVDGKSKTEKRKASELSKTQSKSATSSRASSPASSIVSSKESTKNLTKESDKPYMPDLSESSSSESDAEPKTWDPSPAKLKRIQEQRKEGKKVSLNSVLDTRNGRSSTKSSISSVDGIASTSATAANMTASSSSSNTPMSAAKKVATQLSASDASDTREDDRMHCRYEHEERIKIAGLHQSKAMESQ